VTSPWHQIDGPAGSLRVYSTPTVGRSDGSPVMLLCHELPRVSAIAADAGRAYPALADRLAQECGCRVVAGMLRGAGGSDGDFSATGWLHDVAAIAEHEVGQDGALWLVGFGLGGAIALRAATSDARVCGVASVAGPADLAAWVSDADRVLARCRRSGAIRADGFPSDVAAWAAELVDLAPLDAAGRLEGRPFLVVHGSDDAEVPAAAARALADAAGAGARVELRIVPGASHWLRADPRVVATLVGWIERQR
jgi:uncharacterized protein